MKWVQEDQVTVKLGFSEATTTANAGIVPMVCRTRVLPDPRDPKVRKDRRWRRLEILSRPWGDVCTGFRALGRENHTAASDRPGIGSQPLERIRDTSNTKT